MFDTKICNMCREGSKAATPCDYCGLRDGQREIAELREKYYSDASSEDRKEAQKKYNSLLSVMLDAVQADKEVREQRAEEMRDTKFWEERARLAAESWNKKHNKSLADKRIEDLMNYQDKQNEENIKLKRTIEALESHIDGANNIRAEICKKCKGEEIARAGEFWNWEHIAKKAQEENKIIRVKAKQALGKLKLYKTCLSAKDNLIAAQVKRIEELEEIIDDAITVQLTSGEG